ncbi:hypothetical protein AYJ54_00560 [Bradyrhizobium centrolobii]|uniref:Uncharacterized protein n=1 Tax=Bradyrhizobium centrolobii TaxID=1505087 RepID=A0A176YFN6_9BRAD|nr:hypothetical protein AYJ54_00560 [Bradyrhizobium centrolobii]
MNGLEKQMMMRSLRAFALGFSLGMAGFATYLVGASRLVTSGIWTMLWLLLMAASIASPILLLRYEANIGKRRRET